MASATSDTIIFMFLGMVLVSDRHVWHTGFVLWSVGLCLIFRFIGVFLLTGVMNHYRIKKIGFEEQFIAAYGGLRGAVAFSLVEMLNDNLDQKPIFVTTTLVVILFTIFIQGTTIKPLVNFLHIQRRRSDRKNLNEEINDTAMDHIMAGVEEVLGQHGDFYLRALMIYYNDRYLKKWFVRPTCESKLKRLFEKIAISEHYAHLYGPVAMIEDKVRPLGMSEKRKSKLVRSTSVSPPYQEEVLLEPRMLLEDDEDVELVQEGVQLRKKRKKKGSINLFPSRHSTRRVAASERSLENAYPTHPNQAQFESDDVFHDDASNATDETQKRTSSEATQALRKAFRDNPYNKLHYKYNRNLVGEEDQELSEHLQRRHMNARRMTSIASSSTGSIKSGSHLLSRPKTEFPIDGGGKDDDEGAGGRNKRGGSLYEGVAQLRERHRKRRHTMAIRRRNTRPVLQSCLSSPESSGSMSSPPPTLPPPVSLKTVKETSPPEESSSEVYFSETSPMEKTIKPVGRKTVLGSSSTGSSFENDPVEEIPLMLTGDNGKDHHLHYTKHSSNQPSEEDDEGV